MKACWTLIIIAWFSLSGCLVIDTTGRTGTPWWAPAYGFRSKQATLVVSPNPHIYKYKQGSRGHYKR